MADIIHIDGIGPAYKAKLVKLGIDSIEALLQRLGKSSQAAQELADDVGAKPAQVQTWGDHAQLWPLSGMTEEYFRLLNGVGIKSRQSLAQQSPKALTQALADRNSKDGLVSEAPGAQLVATWVKEAALPLKSQEVETPSPPASKGSSSSSAAVKPPAPKEKPAEVVPAPKPKAPPVNTFQLILDYAKKAAAAAALPIPIGDLVAVAEVQHEMLRELAASSKVPFSRAAAAAAIKALAPAETRATTLTSAIKVVPFLGALAGGASGAYLHAVATYAIGNTLLDHFQRGGNFTTFNAQAAKANFQQHEKMGGEMLRGMLKHKVGLG